MVDEIKHVVCALSAKDVDKLRRALASGPLTIKVDSSQLTPDVLESLRRANADLDNLTITIVSMSGSKAQPK